MSPPLICLITDRRTLRTSSVTSSDQYNRLIDLCRRAAQAGVDYIQIREKDLTTRELCALVSDTALAISATKTALLVNDRIDVALAAGAHGVHLRSDSISVADARRLVGQNFIIGVSTHSIDEAFVAAQQGADYVLFGPIFETPSKIPYGPPLGLERLTEAAARLSCPVIALGGIDSGNARKVLASGARGIAAIRMFAEAGDLTELVDGLKH